MLHRRFAIARRFLPSGRTQPGQRAIAPQRSQPSPIRGSVCGRHWRCQSAPWEVPSTGIPCAGRIRLLQRPVGSVWVVGQRRACARTSFRGRAPAQAPAAPHAPRSRPSPPRIRLASSPSACSDAAHGAAREGSVLFTDTFLARTTRTSPPVKQNQAMMKCAAIHHGARNSDHRFDADIAE